MNTVFAPSNLFSLSRLQGRIYDRLLSRFRLIQLSDGASLQNDIPDPASTPFLNAEAEASLSNFDDRLGKAGFLTIPQRIKAGYIRIVVLTAPAIALPLFRLFATHGAAAPLSLFLFALSGLYFGLVAWLLFLKYRQTDFEREVLFRLPLFLESLILVVEAGMSVLPALESVISRKERLRHNDPVSHVFSVVYRITSSGLPFDQSLEIVAGRMHVRALRHVLLHLDISANAGGELVPSLRALSDHAHIEWKLSVEERVRRLENFVIFPVFASVLGMILLISAVPLVPLLKLQDTLKEKQSLPLHSPSDQSPSPLSQFEKENP